MFWVATAPTLARVKAQRAATAVEEELTTMPKAPVTSQRAVREKVTGDPPSGRDTGKPKRYTGTLV